MHICIINGPNLNLLAKRETEIYGNQSFDSYFKFLKKHYETNVQLSYFQSNHEGSIVDYIHEVGFSARGIVINAGAYTHTSIAIADAMAAVSSPFIEVHISNIQKRESFRHTSYLAANCIGSIVGLGLKGYDFAIHYFLTSE